MSDSKPRLRVLVADDSPVARRLLVHILNGDPEIHVVAEAADGAEAVKLAARHKPDVIVMDTIMPVVDGLEATQRIMQEMPTPVVLVSGSYDPDDVSKSFQALQAGALTILAKPRAPQAATFASEVASLTVTVKLMAEVKVVRRAGSRTAVQPAPTRGPQRARLRPAEVVAIGASTGGPAALATILGALPDEAPVPIMVVQHIAPGFHQGLVEWLDGVSPLSVRLAQDGQSLRAGEVLMAPADLHLGVTEHRSVVLSSKPPIGGHRPSANHLFRSVARAFGPAALGVVLSGMGDDGAAGLRTLKEAGGRVLAQDEATSVVYGMPREAVALGIVDQVVPLDRMAGVLVAAWNGVSS